MAPFRLLPFGRPILLALLAAALGLAVPVASAQTIIVLDTFDLTGATGTTLSGTTWEGSVVRNLTSITVGSPARDDNGWGATHLSINATGMTVLSITAQRNAGHLASSVSLQFEDNSPSVNTRVISLEASLFGVGTPTTVNVPLGLWPAGFNAAQITSWSIGGGGIGADAFRMTFQHAEFSGAAIPEPSTTAALIGVAAVAAAFLRRRRT